jgi:NAD(P)H-dependent flavin oxidoreductase YrpB (nitropropane dioxygenase family)
VFADVVSLEKGVKACEGGADGLVAVGAGAGGEAAADIEKMAGFLERRTERGSSAGDKTGR